MCVAGLNLGSGRPQKYEQIATELRSKITDMMKALKAESKARKLGVRYAKDMWKDVMSSLDVKYPGVTASQKFSSGATNTLSSADKKEAKEWLKKGQNWIDGAKDDGWPW